MTNKVDIKNNFKEYLKTIVSGTVIVFYDINDEVKNFPWFEVNMKLLCSKHKFIHWSKNENIPLRHIDSGVIDWEDVLEIILDEELDKEAREHLIYSSFSLGFFSCHPSYEIFLKIDDISVDDYLLWRMSV